MVGEKWEQGDAYEAYVGRWSRRVAAAFVPALGVPAGADWLDVGSGTGVLSEAVLAAAEPRSIVGVDPSAGFVATARARIGDPRARFAVADARALPFPARAFGAVVSGLTLNFVPGPETAVAEFARVAAAGAVVAGYVWDYAEGMTMMRLFWDAAATVDPGAAELAESRRFPVCRPGRLRELWAAAGLTGVVVDAIEVPTVFAGFDDFWNPFLGGQGSAPGYLATLDAGGREAVRELLRERLPAGPIALSARAWAVRGTVPA